MEQQVVDIMQQDLSVSRKREDILQRRSMRAVSGALLSGSLEVLKFSFLNNGSSQQIIIQVEVKMDGRKQRGRFLDVSQYMLKEFSPLQRAMGVESRQPERLKTHSIMMSLHSINSFDNLTHQRGTPQIEPIDHDASTLKITPFLNGLIELADSQLDDFSLDGGEGTLPQGKSRDKLKRDRQVGRPRSNSWVLLHLDHELEDIVQQYDSELYSYEDSNSYPLEIEEQSLESFESDRGSQKIAQFDLARIRTQTEYKEKMDKYIKQPKATLTKEIKRIANSKDFNQDMKQQQIKNIIMGYIVDFQVPCFEEAWEQHNGPFQEKVNLICKGIDQSFGKKIGQLTFQNRRIKLLKYLEKKKLRKWRKKVSYDCRKKVADSRLRIKGKFVTREQVCQQLGISDIDVYTGDQIKELLERRREGQQDRQQFQE